MLRFKLRERISAKEIRDQRRISLQEIAQATGITRNTLSKLLRPQGCSIRTQNLERLCAYFDCRVEELVEYQRESGATHG